MDENIFARIIGRLYEGVEDPAAQAEAIDANMRVVEANSALLFSFYKSPEDGGFWFTRNLDESVTRTITPARLQSTSGLPRYLRS